MSSTPIHRVWSAVEAIRLLKNRCNWAEASALAKQALSFMSIINNQSLDLEDQ